MELDPASFSSEILTGVLVNRARKIFYPIYRGVPRLLVFPTELTREFAKVHAERLTSDLPGFNLPHETPPPGEEDVFAPSPTNGSSYDWDSKAYWNLNAEDIYGPCDSFWISTVGRSKKSRS